MGIAPANQCDCYFNSRNGIITPRDECATRCAVVVMRTTHHLLVFLLTIISQLQVICILRDVGLDVGWNTDTAHRGLNWIGTSKMDLCTIRYDRGV